MWIRLKSYKDAKALLISLEQVTHIAERAGGGSTLYFANDTSDAQGKPKPRVLAVQDSIEDITRQVNAPKGSRSRSPA